jgi:ADP-ribose pyrophosphatase YjhB (NUDIX family)
MEYSAGILVIQDNEILICHPTNSKWVGTFGIPKGRIEGNEGSFKTAIREFEEETGVSIPVQYIETSPNMIEFKDDKNKTYKIVYYYLAYMPSNFLQKTFPKNNLQLNEIDWAGFVTKADAKKLVSRKQVEILKFLK